MVDKEKGYMGSSAETTGKRANLAAASAGAAPKARGAGTGAGRDGREGRTGRGKPTEEELTAYAQDLDRSMVEKARTSFRRGLIASVVVAAVVVALIFAAKAYLGIGA